MQEVSHGRVPVWPWRGKDGAAVLQALSMETMSLFWRRISNISWWFKKDEDVTVGNQRVCCLGWAGLEHAAPSWSLHPSAHTSHCTAALGHHSFSRYQMWVTARGRIPDLMNQRSYPVWRIQTSSVYLSMKQNKLWSLKLTISMHWLIWRRTVRCTHLQWGFGNFYVTFQNTKIQLPSRRGCALHFSFAGNRRWSKKSPSQVHLHTKNQPLGATQRWKHLGEQGMQVDFLCRLGKTEED